MNTNRWGWAVVGCALVIMSLFCVSDARQERPRERKRAEKKNRIGQPVRLLEVPADLEKISGLNEKVVVPMASLMMRSPAEVSRVLGQPTEKGVTERYGSHDLVCYYRAGGDVDAVRVLFENGKKSVLVSVTFKQPIRRERALGRTGMASLSGQPHTVIEKNNLVWDGHFAGEKGHLTLEAAQRQPGLFWGVRAESLLHHEATRARAVDEGWGVYL